MIQVVCKRGNVAGHEISLAHIANASRDRVTRLPARQKRPKLFSHWRVH
jgi:hypothetical protein